jgi:hypothetical protein
MLPGEGRYEQPGPCPDPAPRSELEQAVAVLGSAGATVALLTTPCSAGRERADGGTWPENDPSQVTRAERADPGGRSPASRRGEVVDLYAMLCPAGRYEQQLDGVHIQPGSGAWLRSHPLPVLRQIGERHCGPRGRLTDGCGAP